MFSRPDLEKGQQGKHAKQFKSGQMKVCSVGPISKKGRHKTSQTIKNRPHKGMFGSPDLDEKMNVPLSGFKYIVVSFSPEKKKKVWSEK